MKRRYVPVALVWALGCQATRSGEAEGGGITHGPSGGTDEGADEGGSSSGDAADDADDGADDGDPTEPDDDAIRITHTFGPMAMAPFADDDSQCASWTLHNEQALYVNNVVLSNEGGFHHSNWFVVPEDVYGGIDGYWPCEERGYTEIDAATQGTVLFAQSTQSYVEEQQLSAGAVIKIPAYSRIVAGLHTLNLAPRDAESGLWLSLELLHPADVTGVVTPASIQYKALDIPAMSESRFTADGNLDVPYGLATGDPLALRVHYVLPHYHYLGNYFDVTVKGGLLDGESIFRLEGFNADANGKTFDPPLDLPGATGLEVTCGYDNWRDQSVQWGNGDGEMCVMLALVESGAVMGGSVDLGNHLVEMVDDVHYYEGTCLAIAVDKTPGQEPPTQEEIDGPLYLPPVSPGDEDVPPIPECDDADPSVAPEAPVTLTSLRDTVFTPACTFSACHGQSAAGQLDLSTADLHALLLDHTPLADAGMPLITPGDPDRSWLYHLLSRCEPTTASGGVVPHMPLNAPVLLDDALIAKLRAWIEAGAADD